MKLKKVMKNYYKNEVTNQQIPGLPDSLAGMHQPSHSQSKRYYLDILFNSATLAFLFICIFLYNIYKNPLIEVVKIVNEKYSIDANFRQGMERLPEYMKHNKLGE